MKVFLRENCEPGNERSSYEKWVLHAGAQRIKQFVEKFQVKNGQVWHGPANRTHGWQPVGRGHVGAKLKAFARQKFDDWLCMPRQDANGDNVEQGDGIPIGNWQWFELGKMRPEDLRVLMTWVLGEGWVDLMKRPKLHEISWAKSGCFAGLGPRPLLICVALNWHLLARQQQTRIGRMTHILLAGIEPPSVVEIVALKRAFVCAATKGTEWDDEDYFNKSFTGSPNFECKVIKKVAAPVAAPDAVPQDAPEVGSHENSDWEGDGGSSSTESTSSSSSD